MTALATVSFVVLWCLFVGVGCLWWLFVRGVLLFVLFRCVVSFGGCCVVCVGCSCCFVRGVVVLVVRGVGCCVACLVVVFVACCWLCFELVVFRIGCLLVV